MNATSLEPVDIDQATTEPGLHDDVCQASYVIGARMGFWAGLLCGGLAIFLLIKIGQWVGA